MNVEELYDTEYYKYYAAYLLTSLKNQGNGTLPSLDSLNMHTLRHDLVHKHDISAKMLAKAELMAMILLRKRLSLNQTKLQLAVLDKSSVLYKQGETVDLPEIDVAKTEENVQDEVVEEQEEEEETITNQPEHIPFCLHCQKPPLEPKQNSQLHIWLEQKLSKVRMEVSQEASDFLSKALHTFMYTKLNNVVNKYKRARHSYKLGSGKCTYAHPLYIVREPNPAINMLRKHKIKNMTKMLVQKAEETIEQTKIKNAHVNVEKCYKVAVEVDEKKEEQLYEHMTCGSIPPKFLSSF